MSKHKIKKCCFILCLLMYASIHASPSSMTEQRTNSAIFIIECTIKSHEVRKQDGVFLLIPAATYQLTLPFSEYKKTPQSMYPNYRYFVKNTSVFHAHDGHISFTPTQNRSMNFDESETPPQPTNLLTSPDTTIVQVYKPVTIIKNSRLFLSFDSITLEQTGNIEDNLLQIFFKGNFNEMLVSDLNQKFGPGKISVKINNLDPTLMAEIEEEIVAITHASSQEEKQKLQLKLLNQLKYVCKPGSQLTAALSIQTPFGELKGSYILDLPELVADSLHVSTFISLALDSTFIKPPDHRGASQISPNNP